LETVVKKLYEAMFLVDSADAAADWEGVNKAIKKILKKAGAEIVSIRKWDERKLAYAVNGKARGTYILCYFRADGEKLVDIERDVQLSERIMRVLVLCAEHFSQEDIEKDTPVTRVEKQREKAAAAAEKAKEEKLARESKELEEAVESPVVDVVEGVVEPESEEPKEVSVEEEQEQEKSEGEKS
jgi:small subunit ribosomal protein S6